MSRIKMVPIDTEKTKIYLEACRYSAQEISLALNHANPYVTDCLRDGKIAERDFPQFCEMLGIREETIRIDIEDSESSDGMIPGFLYSLSKDIGDCIDNITDCTMQLRNHMITLENLLKEETEDEKN